MRQLFFIILINRGAGDWFLIRFSYFRFFDCNKQRVVKTIAFGF